MPQLAVQDNLHLSRRLVPGASLSRWSSCSSGMCRKGDPYSSSGGHCHEHISRIVTPLKRLSNSSRTQH